MRLAPIAFSFWRAVLMQALVGSMVCTLVLGSLGYDLAAVLIVPAAAPLAISVCLVQILAETYGPSAAWRISSSAVVTLAIIETVLWVANIPAPDARARSIHAAWFVLLFGPQAVLRGVVGGYILAGLTLWATSRFAVRHRVRLGARLLGPALLAGAAYWATRWGISAAAGPPVTVQAAVSILCLFGSLASLLSLFAFWLIRRLRAVEWRPVPSLAPVEPISSRDQAVDP